jgi:hypothetical protein
MRTNQTSNELPLDVPACRSLRTAEGDERDAMIERALDAQEEWQSRSRARKEWREKSESSDDLMDIEERVKRTEARRHRLRAERIWRDRVPVGRDTTWWAQNSRASK